MGFPISGARTVRVCVRGEGVDKGRERDIGCAQTVRGGARGNLADFHSASILFAWVFGFPA